MLKEGRSLRWQDRQFRIGFSLPTVNWSPFYGSGVTSGTSPRDSFHYHMPTLQTTHRRQSRGAVTDMGTPKATSPLPGAERMNGWEGPWSGGPVK